uniref:Bromodomain-containing protein 8 n=3 Tax=Oncorhynchus TaxID=8016 RepID=A0A8C7PJF1_ONCMY
MAVNTIQIMLSVGPTEPWSLREKLCLASSVMRSGDQNWVSVSRAIKPFSEQGRPPDWFSQKHCASQYSELLETTEAPKRKRGEKGEVVETIEDVIVRRLTAERIEELKKLLRDTQDKYRKLKKEVDLIQTGHLDSRLEDLKKKQDEDEADLKRKTTDTAYQARQAVKNTPKRVPSVTVRSPLGASPTSMEAQTDTPTPPTDTAMPQAEETSGTTVCFSLNPAVSLSHIVCQCFSLNPAVSLSHIVCQCFSLNPAVSLSHIVCQCFSLNPAVSLSHIVCQCFSLNPAVSLSHIVCQCFSLNPAVSLSHIVCQCFSLNPAVSLALEREGISTVARKSMLNPLELPGFLHTLVIKLDLIFIYHNNRQTQSAVVKAELGEELELVKEAGLVEEDLVAVSYMGDELDLETVGDIIAIIEEKVDDSVEALDAAAVEAALSLCEEAVSAGHSLSGPWEAHDLKSSEPGPTVQSDPTQGLQGGAGANPGVLEPDTESGRGEAKEGLETLGTEVKDEDGGSDGDPDEEVEMKEECGEGEGPYLSEVEPAASESEDGYGPSSQRYTTADSLASSPASSQFSICGEDQEAVQAQKIWKKAIMLVWRAAANHRYASVFLQSVSDDIAPGYHSIVHRPMDLSAIKKSIEAGQIRTTAEFQRDIMLMFQNAVMYNSSDHDVFHMALEMQRDVLEHVQQFLATQLIMQTSESSISTKSLRGREGGRKPGEPVEKDSVPMASPAFLLSLFDGGTRGRRCAIEADMKMKK